MIKVLKPGMLTTIQDEGRLEYLAFGLPRAGSMDRYSARMANILCGNEDDAACLEMTLAGGSFEFLVAARVAICGADMHPVINKEPVDMWTSVDVSAGSVLETGFATSGCRAYLAVSGGIDVPVVMGSRATYTRAKVGGYKGRALVEGDEISIGEARKSFGCAVRLPASFRHKFSDVIELRVLLGPQDDMFTDEGIVSLFDSLFTVSGEADRMGYRLEGPAIAHKGKADIISDALCMGAIQIPGNGRPIIMMADCGTTGGYTKVGTVIGPDLWKLAQAKPEEAIRFIRCNEEEALQALKEEAGKYSQAKKFIENGFPASREKVLQMIVQGETYCVRITEEVE